MSKAPDAVVVGGGIIGVATAYELSKRGLRVVLIERNTLASCATYASAGMLAPASDSLCREPVIDLGFESFAMWPAFKDEVEEAGGFPIDFRDIGILRVAGNDDEEATIKKQAAWAAERGLNVPWLSPEEAVYVEPSLSSDIRGASFSPDEHNVTPTRVVEALRRAAVENGVEFREHTPVTALARANGHVTGVRTPDGETAAGTVVLAVGAWGCEAGQWLGMDVPVHPVRGQVAYLNKLDRPLRHTVIRGPHYAVPKNDSSTLIGSTREHGAGYRQETTVGALGAIFTGVTNLVPAVGEASVHHTRAGLRPWSADDLPVIGPAPEADNVVFATGHYASGILLAPITARIVADLITEDRDDTGPMAARRFAGGAP